MNVIRSNRFVTVRAVDLISVLQGDLLEPSLTLVSGADNHVVRFFPVLPFDVTKVSLASRIGHQKLSVLVQVMDRTPEALSFGTSHG